MFSPIKRFKTALNSIDIGANWLSDDSRQIILMLLAVFAVVIIGTLGFSTLEGWSLFDSLYMTITTLATVGYGEVHPLSDTGRAFTIGLIVVGVGLATFVLSSIASKIVSKQVSWFNVRHKMKEFIEQLDNHTIFCGYGKLGRIALAELKSSKLPMAIVEKDEKAFDAAVHAGLLVIKGDATTDETLISAGIKRAQRLVTLLPNDADNLYVILTAKELNPKLYIISRAEDENGEKRLSRAGADKVIAPYRIGGHKIANGLLRPYVTDFIDLAGSSSFGGLMIEEIRIPSNSPINGQSLQESGVRQRSNIIVAGIMSKDGKMNFNPSGSTIIEGGSTLIGIGKKDDFVELGKLLF